jgi:hypothetical protein
LRTVNWGEALEPRKGAGRPPKTDRTTEKLLKEDVKERPAATTIPETPLFGARDGQGFECFTVGRLLRRIASGQKTECGRDGARRMVESCLEDQ